MPFVMDETSWLLTVTEAERTRWMMAGLSADGEGASGEYIFQEVPFMVSNELEYLCRVSRVDKQRQTCAAAPG